MEWEIKAKVTQKEWWGNIAIQEQNECIKLFSGLVFQASLKRSDIAGIEIRQKVIWAANEAHQQSTMALGKAKCGKN